MHRNAFQKCGTGFGRMLWASFLAGLFAIITNSAAEAAANCLPGPQGQASPGTRWHYRIEHPSQKRCWYMKQSGAKAVRSGSRSKSSTAAKPAKTDAPSDSPSTSQSADQTAGQSTIMARLTSAFEALRRAGAPAPEPKAAEPPVKRRARVAKRSEPAKAQPNPLPDSGARAAAPSLDPESREALYQQFLQWRIRQLIAPE